VALRLLFLVIAFALAGCSRGGAFAGPPPSAPFKATPLAQFNEPWAMAFLSDGRLLVTEKRGALRILNKDGSIGTIAGTPPVAYGGQGGFGDVVLHPDFAHNALIYLSWAEPGPNRTAGAAVGRGKLILQGNGGRIDGLQVIWRQEPKVTGDVHFSHRIAFSPAGYVFITSGERFKFTPAQSLATNLGKIVRLTDSGAVPPDNPFHDKGGIAAQIWTLGHRNGLGLAFDKDGRLWEAEMGPMGGDEVNLIQRGRNYGWPVVSNGDNYDGSPIPDHPTHPEFEAPKVWWNPSVSPASLMIYSGALFPKWRGSAFIGALSGQALIRIALDGDKARKAEQWDMGARIRDVVQGPDGAIYVLEDGAGGWLLKLTPK
jgi:glucose/arabinose dehydrogenase